MMKGKNSFEERKLDQNIADRKTSEPPAGGIVKVSEDINIKLVKRSSKIRTRSGAKSLFSISDNQYLRLFTSIHSSLFIII
jgi:hypothetical protein